MHDHAPSGVRTLVAGAAISLLALSCGSTPPEPDPAIPDETSPEVVPDVPREELAIDRIRAGDLEGARDVLAEVLAARYLEEAGIRFEEGVPEDALVALDHVLDLRPRDRAGRLLKAHASLALAEKGMARGGGALLVEGSLIDALEYYKRSGDEPEVLLGASRSAWFLGRTDEALRFAVRADETLAQRSDEPVGLTLVPERVLSEAAFSAYVVSRNEEAPAEKSAGLFATTEDALERLVGRMDDDPWPWSKLSDLYVWESRFDEARGVLERGLDRLPENADLLARLVDVARRAGGSQNVVDVFAALNERHPDIALGIWYEALEGFNLSVEGVMASFAEDYVAPEDPEALPRLIERSEALFRRCRVLEETYTDSCKGYEVMCHAALGWIRFAQERYPEAVAAFRSMEDVIEGGMTWRIEGQLLSGVMGLHLTGKTLGEAGDVLAAGEIYETLHTYQPEDVNWANNTGLFLRDAAVALEALGKRLGAAGRGDLTGEEILAELRAAVGVDPGLAGSDEERAELGLAGNAALTRARELMERSHAAYVRAAELAPDDVRIVNDLALVLVYYLHRDLELAEKLLLRCVEMGEEQLKNEELDEIQRFDLENAWGDAHENLGVLNAMFKGDVASAITWFEKAVEIGPEPRPVVTNVWLEHLRQEQDPAARRDLLELKGWARADEPADG